MHGCAFNGDGGRHYNGWVGGILHSPCQEFSNMIDCSLPYRPFDYGTPRVVNGGVHQSLPSKKRAYLFNGHSCDEDFDGQYNRSPEEIICAPRKFPRVMKHHPHHSFDVLPCDEGSGRQCTGLLEDIVNPPKLQNVMNFLPEELVYPPKFQNVMTCLSEVFEALPSDEDSGSQRTGLLEDIIRPLLKHPTLPDSCDYDHFLELADIMQLHHVPQEIPFMNEWRRLPLFVESEVMEQKIYPSDGNSGGWNSLSEDLFCLPPKSPTTMNHPIQPDCDDEVSQALDDIMQLHNIQEEIPHWEDLFSFDDSEGIEPKMIKDLPAPSVDHVSGAYPEQQKIGRSLIEVFTLEQIEEHITSLRLCIGQSTEEAENTQVISESLDVSTCQLCSMNCLPFATSVYCSSCSVPVKPKEMFYTVLDTDMQYDFCNSCYKRFGVKIATIDGHFICKSRMKKNINYVEAEEPWVECDKCKAWQHQICGLFNHKVYVDKAAEYICPKCYLQEIQSGVRVPLPEDAVPGAKDLPRTSLSDHIETRLLEHLNKEREERAESMGKMKKEVPGAEDLIVRVVLSIEKKSKVKERFLDVFAENKYPQEFSYISKVILLFQKIDGVEVCLFAMYVQEYGSQCAPPNQRCVYISYLDSVKYFRPEVKTVNGEALRTFAYHEILIGYLDFCKKQGFLTCYIWACPPLKGDNYILYCHPKTQKAPSANKLRKWYQSMLKKARKENVVVAYTGLYEHFFLPHPQCKLTITRLPYFDGDCWPVLAEETIRDMTYNDDEGNLQIKGAKETSRRDLKAKGHSNISEDTSLDNLLMEKIGRDIFRGKGNFLMVQLQYFCTHCCQPILSGRLWFCNQCTNFQLCEKCYVKEQTLEIKHKHRAKPNFLQVEVNPVTSPADENNEVIDNELFKDRQTFLHFCQNNHYQHDTLRRAKHSSMMILYHLHNPTSAVSHDKNV